MGDEPQLIAELREAFIDGVTRGVAAMKDADSPETWAGAALRLKGLAASFGAVRLMALANEAAMAPEGDPQVIRKLQRAIERL